MNMIMSAQHHHQYPQPRFPPPLTPSSPLDFTDRIPFNELQLSSETLGSGSFGTVYKGRWRGRHVAVKHFKTREEIDSFLVEVKQLSCVKHQNIVTLYGASTNLETAYLVMEYAEGGSLNSLLHECKNQEYDLRHACSWAMQAAHGVAYLHEIRPKPIMHRDLKPANLLLFSRGKILKICDFGTACTVKTQMTNNTGSASYMAPEVFATSSYLESGDVFSWSIIFWEILARRHPYEQQYSNPYRILWSVKQEGARPTELESCPKIIWNLICRSWDKDPKRRPSMLQVASEMEFIFSLTERPLISASSSTSSSASATPTAATSTNTAIRNLSSRLHDNGPTSCHVEQNKSPITPPPKYSRLADRFKQGFNCSTNTLQSVTDTSNQGEVRISSKTLPKIDLYYQKKTLSHTIKELQRRHQHLQEVVEQGRGASKDASFQEYEALKKRIFARNEELKRIQPDNCG